MNAEQKKQAKMLAAKHGGTVAPSVSKWTTHLVTAYESNRPGQLLASRNRFQIIQFISKSTDDFFIISVKEH